MRLAHQKLYKSSIVAGARAVQHRYVVHLAAAAGQAGERASPTQQQAGTECLPAQTQQQQQSQQQQGHPQLHQQQQQTEHHLHQQHLAPEVPSLMDLLSTHGARLTTAAQMVWAQVLKPGDVAVDATCGNGHDTLFMAQCVGPSGCVHAVDVQASAIYSTRALLASSLPSPASPSLHLHQSCHSQLQALVGSNTAALVAFNLGYLPGGDKGLITTTDSTTAAVEAALEVVRPGGLVSIMAYIGHPGGLQEYEAVRELLSGLSPTYWTSSELRLLNRPSAPVLLLLWRRPDAASGASGARRS